MYVCQITILGLSLTNGTPSYLGLHLWPAGQDPGHAEAEHTPEEVRVLTQMTMAPTGQSLPQPRSNSNTGTLRPGLVP